MPKHDDFLSAIQTQVLIGDGAMGSLLSARGLKPLDTPGPALNLLKPRFVTAMHEEYIRAGASLIETNTYGASGPGLDPFHLSDKASEINIAGAKAAREAAKNADRKVWVAGAMGPIGRIAQRMSDEEISAAYRSQAHALLEGGVDVLLLETFSDLDDLRSAIAAVRSEDSDVPLIAQMAFTHRGVTTSGVNITRMAEALDALPVDVIGANCGGGETSAKMVAMQLVELTKKPISIFPNRGLAVLDEQGRPTYRQGPEYFAELGAQIAEVGVNIVGGCCGSAPQDISALAKLVGMREPGARKTGSGRKSTGVISASELAARKAAQSNYPPQLAVTEMGADRVTVVAEVDPPRGIDWSSQLEGVRALIEAGVDSITVADNPLSILRMSNLAFSAMLMREANANITLHLSCRDRNLLGIQSFLMGAAAMGITNILPVTGDPIATQADKGSSGVFDVSSLKLIQLISAMNRGEFSPDGRNELVTNFCIGGAYNCGVRSLEAEARKSQRKVSFGTSFLLTQPVYDVELATRVLDLLEPLGVRVFIGVMPLVSGRNAEFLHNEVPGISIPEHVRSRMSGLKGKEGRAAGLAMAKELVGELAPRARGVYLITPMDRYEMITELASYARELKVE